MFKIEKYYRIRIKRYSKVAIFALFASTLFFFNMAEATSEPNRFSASSAITISVDNANIEQIGSNYLANLRNSVNIDGDVSEKDYEIQNGANTFELENSQNSLKIADYLNLSEPIWISSKVGNYKQPLPVQFANDLVLGKVTFDYASAKLTPGGLKTVRKFAKIVINSKIGGIYLVGNADLTGGFDANLKISKLRVAKVAKILRSEFLKYDFRNYEIKTENMSNYLASGKVGIKNLHDRSVTFAIYPLS